MSTETNTNPMAQLVERYCQLFKNGQRSPISRRPDEYGMEYENIPSLDGAALQGWFIPSPKAEKVIVANHPMTCNRFRYPGYLDGYEGSGGFEVNFLPDYKALHDAGYNIICNHGISAQGSGGICGALGYCEARDVAGSILYASFRSGTNEISIGLLSRCLAGNSMIRAMTQFLKYFIDIKCMILLQAFSEHAFVDQGAKNMSLDVDATLKEADKRNQNLTGFHLKEFTPIPHAKNVKVPTLFAKVRKDSLIDTKNTSTIFEALGSKETEMIWIEGTTRRFDGNN